MIFHDAAGLPLECLCCGEPESVDLLEMWESGEFMIAACCEGAHEALVETMNEDPDYRSWLLRELGAEAYGVSGSKLRRVADVDGQFLLDWNPQIRPIEFAVAQAFVAEHHVHNQAPIGWRYGAGIWNGSTLIGVVMVGRPVARSFDSSQVVEVNRLCVRRDVPSAFVWNASSMAYGWAAREAKRRGFSRIITYTLEAEAGTTLRAAGWVPESRSRGGLWDSPSRPRGVAAPTCPKVRWGKVLRPYAGEQLRLAA